MFVKYCYYTLMSSKTSFKSRLYCSLDAELTGFDVEKDEIIELGLVFFRLTPQGIEIEKEWEKMFRPTQAVKTRILGLTGLQDSELLAAEPLANYKSELLDLLKDACLVGHNIVMDVRFLEASGLTGFDGFIDTLELVQIFLPTCSSYNLENLVHVFGVHEPLQHRALADARSTARLLSCLLRVFAGFPEELKNKFYQLSGDFVWNDLLSLPFESMPAPVDTLTQSSSHLMEDLVMELATHQAKSLVISHNRDWLLNKWRDGGLEYVPAADENFSLDLLNARLGNKSLDYNEKLVLLKILVWFHTNWQTVSPIELNLTFSGQGAMSWFSRDFIPEENKVSAMVGMSPGTAVESLMGGQYADRVWAIADVDKQEQFLSAFQERSLSWHSLIRLIKNNLESNPSLLDAYIAKVDTFFGILATVVRKQGWMGGLFSVESFGDYYQARLGESAGHLADAILSQSLLANDKKLLASAKLLKEFFSPKTGVANWVEISDIRYKLCSRPLNISTEFLQPLREREVLSLVRNSDAELVNYLLNRLGWEDFVVEERDLESVKHEVVFEKVAQVVPVDLILANLPAILVFGSSAAAREYYESNGLALRQKATVFMHRYSGGLGKIMKNFGLRKESVLIATPELLAASPVSLSASAIFYVECDTAPDITHPYDLQLAKYMKIGDLVASKLRWKRLHLRMLSNINFDSLQKVYAVGGKNSHLEQFIVQLKSWFESKVAVIHNFKK